MMTPPVPGNCYAAQPGNHRNVEPEVLPPSRVVRFINSHAVLEDTDDERNPSNPAVLDVPEQARWFIG